MAAAAEVTVEDVVKAKEAEIEKQEAAIVTNEAKIKEILISLKNALEIAESGKTKTQKEAALAQSKNLKSTYKTVQQSINTSKIVIFELLKELVNTYKVIKHNPKLKAVLEERKRDREKMASKSVAAAPAAAAAPADADDGDGDDIVDKLTVRPSAGKGGKRRKTTTRKQKGRRTAKKQNKNKKSRKQ